ncbi:hypothetical protein LSM04_006551 [Trypanosoma melophagium]|uniref:uncharacterized protein n=1 Tax=Trypanosoma melophagium TaxID=715481 RepID=UPI00351A90D5|nr:hypothetical protein LSM04_006551 [Trypanosoma melophagium]
MTELTSLTDSVLSGKQEQSLQHSSGNDARMIEEEQQREKIAQLSDDNMRLKVRQSQLKDQLEELTRQLLAERSARQVLTAEMEDAKERLQRAKDHLDQQKKDHSGLSLQLCTVTAERDELEAKLNEVWESMAVLEEMARSKDAVNQSLREAVDNEKRERAAQDVLMSAMVTQLAGLEEQVGAVAEAEERQRRVFEETVRNLREEAQRIGRKLEILADYDSIATLEQQQEQQQQQHESLLLSDKTYDGVSVTSPTSVVNNIGGTTDDGLNTSDLGMIDRENILLKSDIRLFTPIHQALRHLCRQIQREREERYNMQQERSVLETHIRALKDELRRLGNDSDGVREKLLRSEAQWAQTTETLENIRQARLKEVAESADTRRRLTLLLHCVDDWCVIEQKISDIVHDTKRLRSALEEGRRMHEAYVSRKEEEIDSITDKHQREIDGQQRQLEQIRHECERYKRAARVSGALATNIPTTVIDSSNATTTSTSTTTNTTNTAGVGNTSIINSSGCMHGTTMTDLQLEHEALTVKYREVLRYVETELEPLAMEQAKSLQEEKQRVEELKNNNDILRREIQSLNNSRIEGIGKLSLFEALVLTVRVLSGTMVDLREMVQQRTALTRYILAYEQMFGPLNVCGDSTRPRAVMRFRKVVVAVLAAHRLLALGRTMSSGNRSKCRNYSDIIIPAERRRGGRIRLPLETYCLVRGGFIQLPSIERGRDGVEYLEDERVGKERGSDIDNIIFVNEQDLQLPVLSQKEESCNSLVELAKQSRSLRSFIDNLLSFVTVPSGQESLYSVKDPLWRGLSNGLNAFKKTALQNHRFTPSEPHRLLHLPPRVPGRESVSPEYGLPRSNIRPPVSGSTAISIGTNTAAAAVAQRTSQVGTESAYVNQKPPARALSYSTGRTQEGNVGKSSNVYPTPQPTNQSKETLQSVEEALQRSLLRDALDSNSSPEIHIGSGFTAEVLSVIHALDQRVMGALEHRSKVEEWRPRR